MAKKKKKTQKDLTMFTVTLQGQTYNIDTVGEVALDVSNLNDELEKQPGKYAEFAMLYVLARSHVAVCERVKKVTWAELDSQIRQEALDDGRKVTENGINQEIIMSTEYEEASVDLIVAEEQMHHLKHMCIALDQRKDMLLALNANVRKEMEGI